MKTASRPQRKGFTLIEVVAVLVLASLGLVFTGMLLVTSTEVFVSSRNAAEDSQKIQVAMNRLVKELTYAARDTVQVTNGRTIEWSSSHPTRLWESGIASWDGTPGSDLTLQGVPLLDNVGVFAVSATSETITLTLRSTQSEGVAHTMVIHPRYDF